MRISWSATARADLDRLHDFLVQYSLETADAAIDSLIDAPKALLDFPRRGPRVREFDPREVREFRAGMYVLRYELRRDEIHIVRLFHTRENRC
jgi:plasmid stabilization system protein ParE